MCISEFVAALYERRLFQLIGSHRPPLHIERRFFANDRRRALLQSIFLLQLRMDDFAFHNIESVANGAVFF